MRTRLYGGIASGLVAGVAFGMIMHTQGSMVAIGGLVGAASVAVGWAVHLAIAIVAGVGYALTLGLAASGWNRGVTTGLAYGMVWWVLGPLVIMPTWLGMPALQINEGTLVSLVGHQLYGFVLGVVFVGLAGRRLAREPVPVGRQAQG